MSLASIQAAIDVAVADLITAIDTNQATYFATNGRYWQGLISHQSVVPYDGNEISPDNLASHPTNQSETWEDFLGVDAPGALPAAIYVNTYKKPDGSEGYKIKKLVVVSGEFYSSSVDSGNDSSVAWSSDPIPPGSVGLPAPTYTSVSPTSGAEAGGDVIVITGTGFQQYATVTIGGEAATSISVDSSTQITCTTPAGTGTVDIVITNIDTQSVTGSSEYTYTAASAPAFVQYKSATGSSSEPGAVVFTSTPTSGNVMLAFVTSNTGVTVTPPAGWTELNSGTTGQNCYWKKYAGEGNSFTFTCGNSAKADRSSVILVEVSGNNTSPIDVNSSASGTNVGASVTTTVANTLVFSGGGDFLETDFATQPTGWTLVALVKAGVSGHAASVAYKTFSASGAIGTQSWSSGTYSGAKIHTIAIAPA